MRTFDQGVLIEEASDAELEHQLAYTIERIADNRRAYHDVTDPRHETVREIVAEQERRKVTRR